jgi:holo-[acyl-carrier protein] synthase
MSSIVRDPLHSQLAGSIAVPVPPSLAGVRVGCDVVSVARVAAMIDRRPGAAEVLFTPAELQDATRDGGDLTTPRARQRLAARFAAKEAIVKLLHRPALSWTDVEVVSDATGAPVVHIHGQPAPIAVSLSHDATHAFAMVAMTDAAPR